LLASLYHLGRLGEPTKAKQKLLREAVDIAHFLISRDRQIERKPALRKFYHGYRGVSSLLLARTAENRKELLYTAAQDLEISGRAEDHSLEHKGYLVEVYLYLQELDGGEAWLRKAEMALAPLDQGSGLGRRLLALFGKVRLQRGFVWRASGDSQQAFALFSEAVGFFSQALAAPEHHTTTDLYLLQQRGLARYLSHTTEWQLGHSPSPDVLDEALSDLRTVTAGGKPVGFGGSTLPSALLLRSNQFRQQGNIEAARSALTEAAPLAASASDAATLSDAIESAIAGLDVEQAMRVEDVRAVRGACDCLLLLAKRRQIPFAALAHGARFLSNTQVPFEDIHGVLEGVVGIAETYLQDPDLDAGARRFLASHAGGLARVLAHHDGSVRAARRVHELYRCAIDAPADNIPIELLAFVGDTALQLAKRLLASGEVDEATGYFEDACEALRGAIDLANSEDVTSSVTFRPVVSHSKLGEAALRLNAATGDAQWLEVAVTNFERSIELGNNSAELKGLLGDVYFRRGRMRGDLADLQRCVELKREARSLGHASRENLSVSARVQFQIGAMTGDIASQRDGLSLLGQALMADPDWPWPAFQLAEVTTARSTLNREEILSGLPGDVLPPELLTAFAAGDDRPFLQCAAERVLGNSEFARRRLGGRRGEWELVYVVEDPHRLLSETFVFKHTSRGKATRDLQTIAGVRQFLQEYGAPRHFKLPTPVHVSAVGTASEEGAAIYMMRKSQGHELGRLVINWRKNKGSNPWQHFRDALQFLAYFHGWACAFSNSKVASHRDLMALFGRFVARSAVKTLILESPSNVPMLLKKDAHPENWLLSESGEIVMLDFESSTFLPLGVDVAQLLEDYPLLNNDYEGWKMRLDLLAEYLEKLRRFGMEWTVSAFDLSHWYSVLALSRCEFGLRRLANISRQRPGSISSSALRASEWRAAHLRELLRFLSNSNASAAVRACATEILQADKPTA
jgi:tetratricopeptide (TPR) repeat protein